MRGSRNRGERGRSARASFATSEVARSSVTQSERVRRDFRATPSEASAGSGEWARGGFRGGHAAALAARTGGELRRN